MWVASAISATSSSNRPQVLGFVTMIAATSAPSFAFSAARSTRPRAVAGFTSTSTIGQRSLQGATLSDVDGDGRGDVVFVVKALKESKFTGVQVMRSTGSVFESATVWAETPACDSSDCRIEFPGS